MSYERFAYVYDALMKNAPYEKWLKLLLDKWGTYDVSGKKILDLACGTGEFTVELARCGFEVAGVDLSEEMLSVANEKASLMGLQIPFYQQDMAGLEGLGVYDGVTIFCDSLNYLRTENDVQAAFRGVNEHLKSGGLFMFDVHSVFKMEQIFQNHTFAVNDEDVSYIWDCFPGEEPYSVEHDLSFFVRDEESGLYDRFDEWHYQRTYQTETYERWLNEAGFEVLEVLADLNEEPPSSTTERILYICRKK
ncbi:class I SAM-dependent DNA methyltransferase [Actinomycetes bacterium NPDC127524]